MLVLLLSFVGSFSLICAEKVLMTEVFAIPIEPALFNWTFEGIVSTIFTNLTCICIYIIQPTEPCTNKNKINLTKSTECAMLENKFTELIKFFAQV